jgi:hypothetical protein
MNRTSLERGQDLGGLFNCQLEVEIRESFRRIEDKFITRSLTIPAGFYELRTLFIAANSKVWDA